METSMISSSAQVIAPPSPAEDLALKAIYVWTPEAHGDMGITSARAYQETYGGWIFVSSTSPGFVVWFNISWTISEVFDHEVIKGHDGEFNPI